MLNDILIMTVPRKVFNFAQTRPYLKNRIMVNMSKVLAYSRIAQPPVSESKSRFEGLKVFTVMSWPRVLLRCTLALTGSKGFIPYTANHLASG
jgi:hypothetical protein